MTPQTLLFLALIVSTGMIPYLGYRWWASRHVQAQFVVTGCFMTCLLVMFYASGITASLLSIVGFFIKLRNGFH